MKTLKKLLLLLIFCRSLLVAAVATAGELLENIHRQAEFGDAVAQSYSGIELFDTVGNLVGIVTSQFADEPMERIAFAIPADLALEIQE